MQSVNFQSVAVFMLVALMMPVVGCETSPSSAGVSHVAGQPRIELLTRDGCDATPAMHANLEGALRELGDQRAFVLVDLDALDRMDPRRGYGSPTILIDGVDLFGQRAPRPGVAYAPT